MNKRRKVLYYVHYDKKFTFNQINFLIKNLSEKAEQRFYIYGAPKNFYESFSGDVAPFNIRNIVRFLFNSFFSDRIVLNGLFNRKNVALFAIFPCVLKKAVWIPWGHDLYWRQAGHLSLKDKIFIQVQKVFMRNLYAIATQTPGDYRVAIGWYGGGAKYIEGACSLFEFDFQDLDLLIQSRETDSLTRIQIGNSSDPSNNHYEILDGLSKFSVENIEIVAPLSYGDVDYADNVIKKGKKIFGFKFRPITVFQDSESYNKHLSQVDILIFNHKRQQGFGNLLIAMYLGSKIFLDGRVETYKYLKNDLGCKVNDVNDIYFLGKDELFSNQKINIDFNRMAVKKFFDKEWQILSWYKVLVE